MLAYDARETGDSAGLHAFIVGVSRYDHLPDGPDPRPETFGLDQLSGSARTAAKLAQLLIDRKDRLARPLKTCRLLLSPTQDEAAEIGTSLSYGPARLADVTAQLMEWHNDAKVRSDNATLFFFSGHGIQQSVGSSYLLLQDWLGGTQPLDRALYLLNVYNGMRKGTHEPDMAELQVYIVDACRNSLSALGGFEHAAAAEPFLVRRGGTDDRVAPIFFSATPGRNAFAFNPTDPNGATLFGGQLLCCLAGAAGEKRRVDGVSQWVVTLGDLAAVLSDVVNKFNRDRGVKVQTFVVDHHTDLYRPVHFLDAAPIVDVALGVRPELAKGIAKVELATPMAGAQPIIFGPPLDPQPYRCKIEAGTYSIRFDVNGGDADAPFEPPPNEFIVVKGPSFELVISLRPR